MSQTAQERIDGELLQEDAASLVVSGSPPCKPCGKITGRGTVTMDHRADANSRKERQPCERGAIIIVIIIAGE